MTSARLLRASELTAVWVPDEAQLSSSPRPAVYRSCGVDQGVLAQADGTAVRLSSSAAGASR